MRVPNYFFPGLSDIADLPMLYFFAEKGYGEDYHYRPIKNIFSYLESVNEIIDHFLVEEKYQEWFCSAYPELIHRIQNLNPELASKYSHCKMIGRFGLF